MLQVNDASFAREVLEHEGPVLVDFWAPWCMPCRMLGPIIEKLAAEFEGRVKIVKINVDENPVVASQYQIMAIPTMITLSDGQAQHRIPGLVPESHLRKLLEQLAS